MMMMKNMRESEFVAENNSANFNLLEMSSDDDTKQLVLPPLPKSKHAKRKLNGRRPEMIASVDSIVRTERPCSASAACFISLLIIILLSEVTLGIYVYLLKTRVDQVQGASEMLSPTPPTSANAADYHSVISKQLSLETSIQSLNTSVRLLQNTMNSLQMRLEEHVKSVDQSVLHYSSLPAAVEATSSRLSLLEVDVASLRNTTNNLQWSVQIAFRNQSQAEALRETLDHFQDYINKMLQEKEEEMWNRTLSVREEEQFNSTRSQLAQLSARLLAVNSSIMLHVEESRQEIHMQFVSIKNRLRELEDSPGCVVHAPIENCTVAEEVFEELVMHGDRVSVDDIHRQKSNNCSLYHLQLHAGTDGWYSLSDFTSLLGFNCTEQTSVRSKRSSSMEDLRRMVQSMNKVEVP